MKKHLYGKVMGSDSTSYAVYRPTPPNPHWQIKHWQIKSYSILRR